MGTCFVIQPFDNGAYDKRYRDVIEPAIKATGLEAYRVDKDPAVNIPIEDIERGIRDAEICIAEISIDNPNVWFELGYAIAAQKEVVLICSRARRESFPFDVQHRRIIRYTTDSPQDFEKLRQEIIARIKAIITKDKKLGRIRSSVSETDGLAQHEIAALVSITENLEGRNDSVTAYTIKQDMDRSGFNQAATFLALTKLEDMGLVLSKEESGYNSESYFCYQICSKGIDWLHSNEDLIDLKAKTSPASSYGGYGSTKSSDDDIPF